MAGCVFKLHYTLPQPLSLHEDNNILNVVNENCLHYIILHRINHALMNFRSAWNSHPLSSEGNLSPVQLWITGLLSERSMQSATLSQVSSGYYKLILYVSAVSYAV